MDKKIVPVEDAGRIKIGVWGDSVMLGVVLDEVMGRYRVIKDSAVSLCSQALKVSIENFSKFGCTVEKGRQRLTQFLDKGKSCDLAVLEYGGNDCDLNWAEVAQHPEREHLPKVPLTAFAAHVQGMIDALMKHGVTPLLTSLPPLHPGRYLDWICRDGLSKCNIIKFLGDVHHIYRHQERYSLEITQLAVKNSCRLVDIRAAFLNHKNYHDLLCLDGIHPNDKGQRLIRETFVAYVEACWPNMGLVIA